MGLRDEPELRSWAAAAHAEIAFRSADRWLGVGIHASVADSRKWEDATYFSRILIVRGITAYLELQVALQRETASSVGADAIRYRAAASYWDEGQHDLDRAHRLVTSLGDTDSRDTVARFEAATARDHLRRGITWLDELREQLPSRAREVERDVVRPLPERELDGIDLD